MTERPFALRRLDHVTLVVKDMAKALTFYNEVLGCTPAHSSPQYGMEFLDCGDDQIVLVDVSDPHGRWALPPVSGGRNMDHLCIAVGGYDPDHMRRYLIENGVEISDETMHGAEMSFYVRDPFGNQIELRGVPDNKDDAATARWSTDG